MNEYVFEKCHETSHSSTPEAPCPYCKGGTVHELKCYPEYYAAVESGAKPFEMRKNDRPFKVGDVLRLREYDSKTGYTGAKLYRTITYVLDLTVLPGDNRPVIPGYVVLGLGKEAHDG